MRVFRSPTENHPAFKGFPVSMIPETYGVDFYWIAKMGKCGIQRKEWKDFFASVEDGRLAKEFGQMEGLAWKGLILEGTLQITNGHTTGKYGTQWSEEAIHNYLLSVQHRGVAVVYSGSHHHTASKVEASAGWTDKGGHHGTNHRPGPKGKWGKPTNRDYAIHVMSGVPGVGHELASRIWDKYGCPIQWTVGVEELMQVPGIGKKKATMIIEGLQPK